MSSVGTKNTGPELQLRRLLHKAGYRFRLHPKNLPGKPDIAFPARRKAIFVHGCFWHSHGCSKGQPPKSRAEYWGPKLEANRRRDEVRFQQLNDLGWSATVVWQCELSSPMAVLQRVKKFLDNG
jgi:DNA mismatch endonuclease (patch repair protein)